MAITSYRDLIAWQKSMMFVREVYRLTKKWPADEQFGLTSQVRRAAVSIPSNIAEGHGRRANRDFARFLNIAHGSLMEVETQLQIVHDLGYLPAQQFAGMLEASEEIGRIIYGLIKSTSMEV